MLCCAASLAFASMAALAQSTSQQQPDAQAGQESQTLRVQVRLVSLFVNVTDVHGAPVADLEKSNFALTEDGIPQTISIFEKQTNVPLSVVLAIDTSGSTRRDESAEQHAARDFAQAILMPGATLKSGKHDQPSGRDQLALFDFNSDVREVVPFTDSVHRVDSGIGSLSRGPATAFYSAILLASQSLAPRSGRKVLVVVSDGGNTVTGTSFDEALAEAQRSDVIIYNLIDVPIEADAGRNEAGEHAMIILSQETGGQAFYVNQGGLAAAFRKVSDDLRTQYLLAYYPQHGGRPVNPLGGGNSFHALHVSLRAVPAGAEDTAHYRNGYYRGLP